MSTRTDTTAMQAALAERLAHETSTMNAKAAATHIDAELLKAVWLASSRRAAIRASVLERRETLRAEAKIAELQREYDAALAEAARGLPPHEVDQ